MQFAKISDNGKRVKLEWSTTDEGGGVTEHVLNDPQRPLKPFKDAMQAFRPHVAALLEIEDDLDITGIALNTEKKGGARGIVISCRKEIGRANAPWFFNTPHLREASEDSNGEPGYYSDAVAGLIAEMEKQAELYKNGQREQAELFEGAEEESEED